MILKNLSSIQSKLLFFSSLLFTALNRFSVGKKKYSSVQLNNNLKVFNCLDISFLTYIKIACFFCNSTNQQHAIQNSAGLKWRFWNGKQNKSCQFIFKCISLFTSRWEQIKSIWNSGKWSLLLVLPDVNSIMLSCVIFFFLCFSKIPR